MGIWEAVALMALGAALVAWPLVQRVTIAGLQEELRDAQNRIKVLRLALAGAKDFVEMERNLDSARDLPPADELGVLLRPRPEGGDPASGAAGELGAGPDEVDHTPKQGGPGDSPV